MASTRRLAAILAADVAGYSRLMGADEEGTHERLKAHRRELIDRKIAEHSGRTVKTTGDGMLLEFPSVVDAMRCAEVQRAMIDREGGMPEDRRIRFRIGINLGDVIVEDDDIFGDGVNVAARLEALSDPGGLCISRMVWDQVRDKLAYPFEDLGEQSVKNIARPVRVYAMRADAVASLPQVATTARSISGPQGIAARIAGLVGGGIAGWRAWPIVNPSSSPPVANTIGDDKAVTLSKPPRLSIVVLPFANLSNDPEQEYFADGITEDLTTDLSRISGSFVIARNTAFTYKGKAVDAKQIGRELGVRYVLEGSVRRSGSQVRVNAQLVDAETGAHLWAERFDRDNANLLRIQDDITQRIASELRAELVEAESQRAMRERPNNPDAIDLAMQARALLNKPLSPEQNAQIRRLCERALAIDPENLDALVALAASYLVGVHDLLVTDDYEWTRRAKDAVTRALAIDARNARAFQIKSRILAYNTELDYRGQIDEAIDAAETAIALDPNLAGAYGWLARLHAKAGHPERTAALVQQAMRLSPRDPNTANWLYQIGTSQLQMGRYDEAIVTLRKSVGGNPNLAISWANLTAAYLGAGRESEARNVLAELRKLEAPQIPDQAGEQLRLMRVQLALLRRGFWPYTVDGRNTRRVAEAFRAFQRKENLTETGILDEATAASAWMHSDDSTSSPCSIPLGWVSRYSTHPTAPRC
jgi:TolB-like protein/class 3 adenylate cyclase/Tfp pilus assembly protein PilF